VTCRPGYPGPTPLISGGLSEVSGSSRRRRSRHEPGPVVRRRHPPPGSPYQRSSAAGELCPDEG
jgi:hypothetical protein